MTARESPQRLETCLHLCISHINKFSHRCIQTSLSALLHTTHSCHKHSDTQSTTTERKKERWKGKEKRGNQRGEKGSRGRWRRGERKQDRSSVGGDAEMRMLRRARAPKLCSVFCLAKHEPPKSRQPEWMKEKWALVGCGIHRGWSGGKGLQTH